MAKTARTEEDITKERDQFEAIRGFMRTCSLATLRDLMTAATITLEIRTPKKREAKPDVQAKAPLFERT
jgi:hypothetical protein